MSTGDDLLDNLFQKEYEVHELKNKIKQDMSKKQQIIKQEELALKQSTVPEINITCDKNKSQKKDMDFSGLYLDFYNNAKALLGYGSRKKSHRIHRRSSRKSYRPRRKVSKTKKTKKSRRPRKGSRMTRRKVSRKGSKKSRRI
jgi:hypothetical protein